MPWYEQLKPQNWLDLIWQSHCPLCNRSTPNLICLDCDRQLKSCRFQQFHQPLSEFPLFAWGLYDQALKRAIATCKYQNQPKVGEALGAYMATAWQTDALTKSLNKSLVVPIPLHDEKLKTRGFNQAEVIARSFCQQVNLPCQPDLLERIKNTKPQIQTRNKQERESNLSQAFAVKKNASKQVSSRSILLLDDIYTSGSTIRSAIATLRSANLKISGVVVLARSKL